jgi:hypothetical protein
MLTSQAVKLPTPRSRTEDQRSPTSKKLYPRVKSPEELDRQIVQVSVARQVSVSKARRQVEKAASSRPAAQSLKPKVVELSKNRKSTVVIVEGGDDE